MSFDMGEKVFKVFATLQARSDCRAFAVRLQNQSVLLNILANSNPTKTRSYPQDLGKTH